MTTLPPALERFGFELEIAIRRDLGARRRRRWLLRATALSAAVAAVALGLLAVLPGGGSSVVGPAVAALEVSDNMILHVEMRGEQHNPDGSVVTWQSESWQLSEAPFTRRQIEVGSDGIRAESLTRGETNALYDAQTNTIYIATQQELLAANPLPKIEIVSKARLRKLTNGSQASSAFKVAKGGSYSVIATKEGAKRLREQRARAAQDSGGTDGTLNEPFRTEILALLNSGRAQETGHVEVDGRDAIRIESPDGKQVYLVDAETYAPIEWTTMGNGGSVTLRFPVYEELSVTPDSMQVFDLEDQYPGAIVERGAAAYEEAEARLFPHG
jgi:hypothetical protein